MKRKEIALLLALGFICLCSVSVLTAQPLWMRYPSISPDGQFIAFSYKGNLYKVAAAGGQAMPITLHPAHDYYPVWSKDGRSIAFASNRFGNFDVFVTSSNGGAPRRLTYHSANDYPYSFSPDGNQVVFSSARLDARANMQFPTGSLPELYEVSVLGGRPSQLLTTPALEVQFSRDGNLMLFEDTKGYEDPFRKHHTSSIARDIWLHDKTRNSFTKLTNFNGEDRDPVFAPDGKSFYFLCEEDGTLDVFKASLDQTGKPTQITNFDLHPVRYLSISENGTLCYSYNGEIYLQKEDGTPTKVAIDILADDTSNEYEMVPVNGSVTEMVLSPNGKEIAFAFRGEVFVTSIDGSMTKQITNTPEQERMISISPDGKSIAYASERNGSWNIYRSSLNRADEKYFMNASILREEPILVTEAETFQPSFSPDGQELAFIEDRTKLKVINLQSKAVRTILDGSNTFSYSDGDQHYDWSPDGKWFLVNFLPDNYWVDEVGLISADGQQEVFNLSKSGFSDSSPIWAKKGEMVIWRTDKNGLHGVAKTGPSEVDIYAQFFTQDAYEEFLLSKEEYDLYQEDSDKEKKAEDKKEEEKSADEKDDDQKLEPVKIELEGIEERKARLTIYSSRLSDAKVTHDGKYLLYFSRAEKGYDLWRTELRTKETKILAKFGTGGGPLALDKEGKHLFVLSSGKITRVEIASGKKKSISIKGEMTLKENAERAYLFDHVVRQVEDKFYEANLHGAEWSKLSRDYKRFLPYINNNFDFQEMLSELLGELNASHTGARFRYRNPKGDVTAALGAFFDPGHTGNGLKIAEIMDKSPLITKQKKITEGIIIDSIDGQAIMADQNYYPLLNRKVGKVVLLSLFNPESKERWEEKVKPISLGQQNQLLYERWIRKNREMTHQFSDGRIGYMHIRGMSDFNFREFLEDVMGEEVNREALIVDSRFNGGGDLVDDLTSFLSGEQYMTFQARDRQIGIESQRRWTRPSIVLVGESNYSDAHCFPAAYRDQNIGQIVGMPVPGTCTFVWWERMQNGIVFGIPNLAVTDKSGDVLENKQLVPDIQIFNDYSKISDGKDQQLEMAVEALLKKLD